MCSACGNEGVVVSGMGATVQLFQAMCMQLSVI